MHVERRQLAWLAAIIAAGLLSRAVRTGSVLFDKYLGDALYAAAVYMVLRLLYKRPLPVQSMIAMTAIELFQLTGVPAALVSSGHPILWVAGRLLGTHFGWLDLAAYGVGIACARLAERACGDGRIW